MKLKRGDYYVEEPVPFTHVFGIDRWFYIIPTVPQFENPNEVFGYCLVGTEETTPTGSEV
jgi:hypothetical protein